MVTKGIKSRRPVVQGLESEFVSADISATSDAGRGVCHSAGVVEMPGGRSGLLRKDAVARCANAEVQENV